MEAELDDVVQDGAERADQLVQALDAEEERFASVEGEAHRGYRVPLHVLRDALRDLFRDGRTHGPGFRPPALVRVLVHIAVVAGQIAGAVDLQDVLVDEGRHLSPPISELNAAIRTGVSGVTT